MSDEQRRALKELAASIPRHRPWRRTLAFALAGLGIGVGLTTLALRVRTSARNVVAAAPSVDAGATCEGAFATEARLRAIDVSSCSAANGPGGPGAVKVRTGADGATSSVRLAAPGEMPHVGFSAIYGTGGALNDFGESRMTTQRGRCVVEKLEHVPLQACGSYAFVVPFSLPANEPGASFDAEAARRALDEVDLSGCGSLSGLVSLSLEPSGRTRVDGFTPTPRRPEAAAAAPCVRAAFERVRVPVFAGAQPIWASYFLSELGR